MCVTKENIIIILDAFEGQMLGKCENHENIGNLQIEASFTPDSKYIVSGSDDGKLHVWSTQTFNEVA